MPGKVKAVLGRLFNRSGKKKQEVKTFRLTEEERDTLLELLTTADYSESAVCEALYKTLIE